LQPAADADGGGKRPPAVADRRRQARPRLGRRVAGDGRHRRPPHAPTLGALGRSTAARLDRPRARDAADRAVRGRADRQPRLEHLKGRAGAAAPLGRRVRPDDRDGHARPPGGRAGRPDPLPRRRTDRQGDPRVDRGRSAGRHAGGDRAMTAVALKGLLGRKTRSILTGLAIVLGVAMISGTYVLTDTIKKAFNTALTASYRHTDAVISGQEIVKGANATPTVPASLLPRVRALPDVSAAAGGYLFDTIELVDRNSKTISSGGAPNLGFGVDPSESRFNPITLVSGRWASDPHEVVIDTNTATKHHYAVGDSIRAKGNGAVGTYTIVGLGKLSGVSIGGATLAAFDVATARTILQKQGYDNTSVAAPPGTSEARLAREIAPLLPAHMQVRTAKAQAGHDAKQVEAGANVITYFLLAFGGIALFVGAFVIFNTISITVSQRTRELAT